MFSRMLTVPVAAGFAVSLAGCGITGPAHTQAPPAAVVQTVSMGFTNFSPATIRIRVGQTVQWRNTSPIGHTVTADPRLARNPANVELPEGAQPFHSGNIPAGQVWQRTFTVPGTYRYVCLPHERQGMIGTVVVEPRWRSHGARVAAPLFETRPAERLLRRPMRKLPDTFGGTSNGVGRSNEGAGLYSASKENAG